MNESFNYLLFSTKRFLLQQLDIVVEKKVLSDIIDDIDYEVKTVRGNNLHLDSQEIRKFKDEIPKYLYGKARLPLEILLNTKQGIEATVIGDVWDRRIVHYILNRELVWKPPFNITGLDVSILLKKYPTLLHIVLGGDLNEK